MGNGLFTRLLSSSKKDRKNKLNIKQKKVEMIRKYFVLMVFFFLHCCADPASQENEKLIIEDDLGIAVVYSLGFNTTEDTVDFKGYGYWNLVTDSVDNTIRRCLFVTGGCPFPHVIVELPSFGEGQFGLLVQGRKLENSGYVLLRTDDEKVISINIADSVWTFYQSGDTLFGESDDRYYLELNSGGFIPASMLVDEIQIIRLK